MPRGQAPAVSKAVVLEKPLLLNARANYRVPAQEVTVVHCHRVKHGKEEFLVEWAIAASRSNEQYPVYSWHDLTEMNLCLAKVQAYVTNTLPSIVAQYQRGTKRKLDEISLADSGVATPGSAHASAHQDASDAEDQAQVDLAVYNGYLEKKAARLQAKQSLTKNPKVLPTIAMLEVAATTPLNEVHPVFRNAFAEKLDKVGRTRLENNVDHTTPSLDFDFIEDFSFTEGTYRADEAFQSGCDKPCRPDMGQACGCEYTQDCSCLDAAAVNEQQLHKWRKDDPKNKLERQHDAAARRYFDAIANDQVPEIKGLPKRFPYMMVKNGNTRSAGYLQSFYLLSRHPIYECNPKCNCGPGCKTRLVQFGRKVPLVVFKTKNRGWGVYCDVDLRRGQFVDTYLGEVITSEEADRREDQDGVAQKVSYLYALDKWAVELEEQGDKPWVVDGEKKGSVTRFINHSCEPNLRQCTVSYNQSDIRVSELAFFALEDIPAGTELLFDYNDKEPVNAETAKKIREEALNNPENDGMTRCSCGTESCRGLLWAKAENEVEKAADEAAEAEREKAAREDADEDVFDG